MGVHGAKVAGVEMLRAFLRYSKQVEAFEMFVPPSQESAWLHFRERLHKEGVPLSDFTYDLSLNSPTLFARRPSLLSTVTLHLSGETCSFSANMLATRLPALPLCTV